MYRLFHGMALAAAVLAGGLLTAAPARADQPGVLRIDDNGHLFTADGVKAAEKTFTDVRFKSVTHLTVVTYSSIPADRKAAFEKAKDDAGRKTFFHDWARDEERAAKERGVFVLLYATEKNWWAEVDADRQTDVSRDFTQANSQELRKILMAGMDEGAKAAKAGKSADDVKRLHDAALTRAVEFVVKELRYTSAPDAGVAKQSAGAVRAEKSSGGSGIMGYVCIGICVLLGVWLVVGLIRAFTGGGGGGGYGGGGYGGGGYGGGGGGFFSSMIGGMFGAAAGMYMYDQFFGGHSSSSYGSDAAAGGYDNGGTSDTGGGDFDGGNSAGGGGGDWGDSGGGDAGGGGDWGGDAGGGGDWGGGGDAGGGFDGGGGDW